MPALADQPVFLSAVEAYYRAGWPAILPVPVTDKHPPPVGFTGEHGADTSPEQLTSWASNGYAGHSIALRMPDGVIGIDVDDYAKGEATKHGGATLTAYEAAWGPLPATWRSTARGGSDGPGVSAIHFYRVPTGRYTTVLRPDIEIIQRHHRYAVVAPSVHMSVGARYQWYRPDGTPSPDAVPRPGDLTELPAAWVEGLRAGAADAGPSPADHGSGDRLLSGILTDEQGPCNEVSDASLQSDLALGGIDPGSRHDTMTQRVRRIVGLGAYGHPGAGAALRALRERWMEMTGGEGREAEFDRMCTTAARKSVTELGRADPLPADPCLMINGFSVPGPAPADHRGDAGPAGHDLPGPMAAPVAYSWAQVIGTHSFDPAAELDQTLAIEVLKRTWPMMRYASDTKTGWIQRGPTQWELHGDLTRRAVSEVAALMPTGDLEPVAKGKDAPPPTDAQKQAKRRIRLHTNSSAGAISASMRAVVTGGWHPCAIKLAELDAEPEVLWAGGMAYDLRASSQGPAFAAIDPNTPHLCSAAVMPEVRPTPLWDAFLAEVWPDEGIRAWALRVLSIAATGHPDAALPILLGAGGTGKSSTVELIMSLLGSYAHAANPKLLIAGDNSHDTIAFDLKGRRLSFIDEGPREGRWAQERLKQLTGGTKINGRAMNQDAVSFRPTHTLVLTSNDEPLLTDEAVRRRVRLLPCDGDPTAVRAARAALSPAVWAQEAPGVLARLMAEAAAWLADPDSALTAAAPAHIRSRAEEIAVEQDVIVRWVTEACAPYETGTQAGELYEHFVGWCRNNAITRIPSATEWGTKLTKAGFPSWHTRGGKWRGLRIKARGEDQRSPNVTPPATTSNVTELYPTAGLHTGSPVWAQGGDQPGASGDRSVTTPGGMAVTPENSRSTPISSSSVTSVTTLPTTREEEEEEEEKHKHCDQGGAKWSLVTDDLPKGRLTSENEGCAQLTQAGHAVMQGPPCKEGMLSPSASATSSRKVSAPVVPTVSAEAVEVAERMAARPPRPDLEPEVAKKAEANALNAELARLHQQTGRPKTELRKEVKSAAREIERARAVAEVGGEVHALPAVVDRAGHVLPVTLEQAVAVVRAAFGRPCACPEPGTRHLTVDVETSGYPIGHEHYRLRSVQLGDATAVAILDPREHADAIRSLVAEAVVLHAHSATADLAPLDHDGLLEYGADEAWSRMHDTVLPAKLADPASTGSDPGLKKLSPAVLGGHAVVPAADEGRSAVFKVGKWLTETQVDTPLVKSGWAQVETGCEAMLRYAGSDVLDTAALAQVLPQPDRRVLDRERFAQRMTARLTHRGVRIDAEQVARLTLEHTTAQDAVRARVRAFGVDNPGSDPQVAAKAVELGAQLPRTPKGAPSVAKGVLDPLRAAPGELGAFVDGVLAYRHHETALGLILGPLGQLCDRGDGRVRPTVYTIGTNTGRMSMTRMNLQQFSKTGGIRACIVADPGEVLVSADFSGVEIRVAAALSQDPTLLRMLAEGRDLHEEIALQVWGPDPAASVHAGRLVPAKTNRYRAKGMTFGRIYGGGLETLSAQVGVTPAVGQQVLDTLDALTPQLKEFGRSISNAARAGHTRFPSYSGRIIHLPQDTPHKALNYVVQGTARELLIDTMIRWADTAWGNATMFPVHDEVDAFVPAEDGEAATRALLEAMTSELYGVPIVAEADEPSSYWQDST